MTTKPSQSDTTPDQALASLEDGNQRFVAGTLLPRDLMAEVKATQSGQNPSVFVLSCIDSRVPPEIVFDRKIGEIFSARVAGNFVNADIISSAQFATQQVGAKLIVVLGHSECAAIQGACDNVHLGDPTHILSNIEPAVNAVTDEQGDRSSKNKDFVQKVAEAHVHLNVQGLIDRSAVLRDLVERGELRIVGAMYDLASGRITFIPEPAP